MEEKARNSGKTNNQDFKKIESSIISDKDSWRKSLIISAKEASDRHRKELEEKEKNKEDLIPSNQRCSESENILFIKQTLEDINLLLKKIVKELNLKKNKE